MLKFIYEWTTREENGNLSLEMHHICIFIIKLAILGFILINNLGYGSVLPEDEWFVEVSQIAIKMLTGKAAFDNVEGDVGSPPASG